MIKARILWTPFPYMAGFCISDDPDAETFEQVKKIYDFLIDKNVPTTKAVWPFKHIEKCGIPAMPDSTLRGVTLENEKHRQYCKKLTEHGYEICLHGASPGNSKREITEKALKYMKEQFGGTSTFVCHSKNAENIYWENNVTHLPPFRFLLNMYSASKCFGELEDNQYFWGDLCKKHVKQVRLFRTRAVNTLARNPSMPYFHKKKPFVNSWYSATKRSIAHCTNSNILDQLKAENGLTILYQYLHRYADKKTLKINKGFVTAINNLSSDKEILVDTVSNVLDRLRLVRKLYIVFNSKDFTIVNLNEKPVNDIIISLSKNEDILGNGQKGITQKGNRLVLSTLGGNAVKTFHTIKPIRFAAGEKYVRSAGKHIILKRKFGSIYINKSKKTWKVSENNVIGPNSVMVCYKKAFEHSMDKAACMSIMEEYRMLMDQMLIVLREIIFKGRSLKRDPYLEDESNIAMEDHSNW